MKVGKEGIAGAIADLESWRRRDHQAVRGSELEIVANWLSCLAEIKGLRIEREPDWTGNPIDRVKITVGEEAGLFAWELADRLAGRNPSIRVRDDLVEQGQLFLDPCNLLRGEENIVVEAIVEEIESAQRKGDGCRESFAQHRGHKIARLKQWPEGY
jgi:L-seryl-tRNA(Ser) seleniumtransferase